MLNEREYLWDPLLLLALMFVKPTITPKALISNEDGFLPNNELRGLHNKLPFFPLLMAVDEEVEVDWLWMVMWDEVAAWLSPPDVDGCGCGGAAAVLVVAAGAGAGTAVVDAVAVVDDEVVVAVVGAVGAS